MVLAIGLSSLQFVDLNKTRNLFALGVAMCCGHGIPLWMAGHPGAIDTGAYNMKDAQYKRLDWVHTTALNCRHTLFTHNAKRYSKQRNTAEETV